MIDPTQNRHNIKIHLCGDNKSKLISDYKSKNIPSMDLGFELSIKLKDIQDSKFIALEAHEILVKLFEGYSKNNCEQVVIHNLGILFEPDLSFDVANILKEVSKITELIILWEGEIENDTILHWSLQKEIFRINLTEIKPQIIDDKNEI